MAIVQDCKAISVEGFIERYKPHMDKTGENFVAYCPSNEKEFKAVQEAAKERRAWTILGADQDKFISAGMWDSEASQDVDSEASQDVDSEASQDVDSGASQDGRVNRMDYIITDVPFKEGERGNIDVAFESLDEYK